MSLEMLGMAAGAFQPPDYKLCDQRNLIAPARNSFYNESMARGWESKSIESQIESAHDDGRPSSPQAATDEAKKAQRERQSLLLSRAYVLHQIESSSNERYTESLRQALNDLDRKLAELGD